MIFYLINIKKANVILLNELYTSLKDFDLKDEYMKEILDIFQTKTKTIYNFKKDEDTIKGFITKVFGKKKLAGYYSCYTKDGEKFVFDSNFAYLDGKLEFEKGYLTFLTNGVFSYGTYYYPFSEMKFTHFRNNEAKIYIKIETNFVYIIVYVSSDHLRCIFKINNHFKKIPIILGCLEYTTNDLNNEDLINKLESSLKAQEEKQDKNKEKIDEKMKTNVNNDSGKIDEKKDDDNNLHIFEYYLKELKVYQTDNSN